MSIPILLETERLILRSLTVDDVTHRYCGWLQDEEVTRFLEARFAENSLDALRRYVGAQLDDESVVFAAIVEKPDRLIGTIKLGPIDRTHGRGDVGIILGDRQSWGHGYATEAIRAMSRFAFEQLGLFRLSAGAYAVNGGSIKAFTRAGFEIEGVLRSGAQCGSERVDLIQMGQVAYQRDDVSVGQSDRSSRSKVLLEDIDREHAEEPDG